jgi:hypothetical protein
VCTELHWIVLRYSEHKTKELEVSDEQPLFCSAHPTVSHAWRCVSCSTGLFKLCLLPVKINLHVQLIERSTVYVDIGQSERVL